MDGAGTRYGDVAMLCITLLPGDYFTVSAELRQKLDQMDDSPEAQVLREKLGIIFPQPQGAVT